MAFTVTKATQLGPSGIRITYSGPVMAFNAQNPTDATNIANYLVISPSHTNLLLSQATPTSNDPNSIDLFLSDLLVSGTYLVQVSGGVSSVGPNSASIGATTNLTFTAIVGVPTGLVAGISQQTVLNTLEGLFNPALNGPNWTALLNAAAVGEEAIALNNELAFDQLFIPTASAQYLDTLLSGINVRRDPLLGVSDLVFRKVGTILRNQKLVRQGILGILNAYYGDQATRSYQQSNTAQPYSLVDGSQLLIEINTNTILPVTFLTTDFGNIGSITAIELCAVINRHINMYGYKAFAQDYFDPQSGNTYVRIYSGALGLVGNIRVLGGQAQNELQFPTLICRSAGSAVWAVTTLGNGYVQFSLSTGPVGAGFNNIQVGDYVTIYSASAIAANQGTFVVSYVFADSIGGTYVFQFQNLNGAAQTFTEGGSSDLIWYRPIRGSLPVATISNSVPNNPVITLPTTSRAVVRDHTIGAYLHSNPVLTINVAVRSYASNIVTVTTNSQHGLTQGQTIIVQGVIPETAHLLHGSSGGINGVWQVAGIIDPLNFTYNTIQTGNFTAITGTVQYAGAVPNPKSSPNYWPGPYIFDPVAGLAVTDMTSTTTSTIYAGTSTATLNIASTGNFLNNDAYLVIGFGTSLQIGPIPYTGIINPTTVGIDPNYVFPKTIPAGTTINYLYQKAPWVPDITQPGQFWLTPSTAGLTSAILNIKSMVASGFNYNYDVLYPSDVGLGAAGFPTQGIGKLSSIVQAFEVAT